MSEGRHKRSFLSPSSPILCKRTSLSLARRPHRKHSHLPPPSCSSSSPNGHTTPPPHPPSLPPLEEEEEEEGQVKARERSGASPLQPGQLQTKP